MTDIAAQPVPLATFIAQLLSSPSFVAIQNFPPQSAGYPKGGYWLTRKGLVEHAPNLDLSKQTNNNLVLTFLAMGRL